MLSFLRAGIDERGRRLLSSFQGHDKFSNWPVSSRSCIFSQELRGSEHTGSQRDAGTLPTGASPQPLNEKEAIKTRHLCSLPQSIRTPISDFHRSSSAQLYSIFGSSESAIAKNFNNSDDGVVMASTQPHHFRKMSPKKKQQFYLRTLHPLHNHRSEPRCKSQFHGCKPLQRLLALPHPCHLKDEFSWVRFKKSNPIWPLRGNLRLRKCRRGAGDSLNNCMTILTHDQKFSNSKGVEDTAAASRSLSVYCQQPHRMKPETSAEHCITVPQYPNSCCQTKHPTKKPLMPFLVLYRLVSRNTLHIAMFYSHPYATFREVTSKSSVFHLSHLTSRSQCQLATCDYSYNSFIAHFSLCCFCSILNDLNGYLRRLVFDLQWSYCPRTHLWISVKPPQDRRRSSSYCL